MRTMGHMSSFVVCNGRLSVRRVSGSDSRQVLKHVTITSTSVDERGTCWLFRMARHRAPGMEEGSGRLPPLKLRDKPRGLTDYGQP